ncbi:helix-turn-helix domain-containing protein [Kitasatospora gansuensis]
MAQGNGGGRPFGPVRAENPEAEELAEFLRHLVRTSGRTLAELANAVGKAPATVSANLGGRVPTEPFVRAVVAATSRDPRDLRRALTLLEAARNPLRSGRRYDADPLTRRSSGSIWRASSSG